MQAPDEYEILQRVHALVESDYVEGKPRHHLPSARNVEYTPGASCFFIVDYNDFQQLPAATVQAILRHRNILIQNVPQPEFDWSLDTLRELGSVDQSRDIQGIFFLLHNKHHRSLVCMISGSISRSRECAWHA